MTRRLAPPPLSPRTPLWLLTFTDLISLLLAFFVMLFAMSRMEHPRWGEVRDEAPVTAPAAGAALVEQGGADYSIAPDFRRRAVDLAYLQAVLDRRLAEEGLLKAGASALANGQLILNLPLDSLFDQALPTQAGQRTLVALGTVLRTVTNAVAIKVLLPQGNEAAFVQGLAQGRAVAQALTAAGYARQVGIDVQPAGRSGMVLLIHSSRTGG